MAAAQTDRPELLSLLNVIDACANELMLREDCSEGRSLAALFIVREVLRTRA